MRNYKRAFFVFLLIMLIPVRSKASGEMGILMDSFVKDIGKMTGNDELKISTQRKQCIGVFEITAYCPCSNCCGKSDGVTASGRIASAYHTIAADLGMFSFGDEVYINNHKYVVEDCGGAIKGNRIDMFFDSHSECLNYGRRWQKLYVDYIYDYTLVEVCLYKWIEYIEILDQDSTVSSFANQTAWYNQAGDLIAYKDTDCLKYFILERRTYNELRSSK